MKRRVTAVLASAAVLAVTSCSRLTLTDETVATEPAEQETTASVQTGPPKEELETIAPFPDNTEQEMPKEPKGLKLIIATDIHYLAFGSDGQRDRVCPLYGTWRWKGNQLYLGNYRCFYRRSFK